MRMGVIRMIKSVLSCVCWMGRRRMTDDGMCSGSSCSSVLLFAGDSDGDSGCLLPVLIRTDILLGFYGSSSSSRSSSSVHCRHTIYSSTAFVKIIDFRLLLFLLLVIRCLFLGNLGSLVFHALLLTRWFRWHLHDSRSFRFGGRLEH